MQRECDDEDHSEDGDDEPRAADQDPVTEAIAEEPADDQGDDFDGATGGAVEEGFFGRVAERDDELGEEVADASVGDVGHAGVEGKGPGQGVEERFLELVKLEVFVPDSLLVYPNSFNGENAISFAEEFRVQLVVGHDK